MSVSEPTLLGIIKICMVVAAVCTTLFPIVYSFWPWYHYAFGRMIMLQAVAFAIVLDFTAVFQFWTPHDIMVALWLEVAVFILIAASTSALSASIIYLSRLDEKEKTND